MEGTGASPLSGNVPGGNVPGSNVPQGNVPGGNVRVDSAPIDSSPSEAAIIQDPADRERIAARAYELYQARGGGDGRALDDWLDAERELSGGRRERAVADRHQ